MSLIIKNAKIQRYIKKITKITKFSPKKKLKVPKQVMRKKFHQNSMNAVTLRIVLLSTKITNLK